METLVITVRDGAKLGQIEQIVREMEGVEGVKHLRNPDKVSLMAQPALAEEWDSPEDQRWDSLL